jgi:hypothetical protein
MAAEDVPLMGEVRDALYSGHPLDLLGLVSMLILATTARPLQTPEEQPPAIGELVASFVDMDAPETTALLAGLGELLVEDDALRARCRRAVDARHDELPRWLAALSHTVVHHAVRMTHVLGDGDDVLLGVRFADGQEMTCAVNIDHLNGSVVGDAFFVPDSIDAVLTVATAANTDPDTTFEDIAPADARAGVQKALDQPLSMLAVQESDTWPGCRALVQWLTRLMPEGGSAFYVSPWPAERTREVCERFFTSPAGLPFAESGHRVLLEECVGDGDPLRWSAVRLSRLLASAVIDEELVPREVQLDLPEMLCAFVPFAHAESGIRQELTAEAVSAILGSAEHYRAAVRDEPVGGRADD